jgi:hypothetical protein
LQRPVPGAAFLLAAVAAASWCSTAGAQVGQVIIREVRRVDVQAAVQDPAAEDDAADDAVVVQAAPVFMMNDNQFDMWVFGNRNSGSGRNKLDSLLDLNVDDVSHTCGLSGIQQHKLLLAGRGDIKRFLDQVDEKRKKFDKVKTDQNKIGEMYQELLPFQAAFQSGVFGEGSLYAKTLRRILGEYEDSRYQEVVRDKNRFRYRAKAELVTAQLDQTIGFRDEQRRKLVDLILSETPPPKRYGQYDFYFILYQMGKIDREKLKPLFEEKQWVFLIRQLDQVRGMEQFLRNQGMLPAKDEAREIADEFVKALREPPRRVVELPADVFATNPEAAVSINAADRGSKKDLGKGERP